MHALTTFSKGTRELRSFRYPVEKPENYALAVCAAYEQFKCEHPNVSLFDGVHVIFDRAEIAPSKS
jgi:hypothetical protein